MESLVHVHYLSFLLPKSHGQGSVYELLICEYTTSIEVSLHPLLPCSHAPSLPRSLPPPLASSLPSFPRAVHASLRPFLARSRYKIQDTRNFI